MRIVGVEHCVSKTVRVEKAKQEDQTVLVQTGQDVNRDMDISEI